MKNSGDNVFQGIPVGQDEPSLFVQFVTDHDFAAHTRKAYAQDVRKFAGWFSGANREPFVIGRVTTRDVADFRDHQRRQQSQAVATVNRALVAVRKFFDWLVDRGHVAANPAKRVKELRRQQLAPKGLEKSQVRRLLRELELRGDIRATAIFAVMLYAGLRVADLAGLVLDDLMITERSGSLVLRNGKGNKQRSVPLPLPARRALEAYLASRPPVQSKRVFIGERGPLTERGVRALCDKYSALTAVKIHPHLLRHTFSHEFLDANPGDLVPLSQILGHESLNTTARYTRRTEGQLGEASEKISY